VITNNNKLTPGKLYVVSREDLRASVVSSTKPRLHWERIDINQGSVLMLLGVRTLTNKLGIEYLELEFLVGKRSAVHWINPYDYDLYFEEYKQ